MAVSAIIGCGNIGSRHLQSMVRAQRIAEIWVVEPNERARAVALSRAQEVGINGKRIEFVDSVDRLPERINVAVLATSSAERRRTFDELTAAKDVAAIVFEKFLFPRIDDYADVADALAKLAVPAWVNCPRRVWPGYRDVRAAFHGRAGVTMRETGSNWGLASNAVHLLDTYSFVTGNAIAEVTADRLELGGAPSKRAGYIEVFGTLVVRAAASGDVALTCYRTGTLPRLIEFVCAEGRVLIDEKAETATWTLPGAASGSRPFATLPVSASQIVFDDIVANGTCGLPSFAASRGQHELVLQAIGRHAGVNIRDNEPCLIT